MPRFLDGALLIPRFDRQFIGGVEVRLGVESLYSITGVIDSAMSAVRHHDVLIALAGCTSNFEPELLEYVHRDLLNIALGNRDNHGRNGAVLKMTDGTMRLAPLYDFGPSFLDGRAIARVIRWDGEEPGSRDWNRIIANLATRLEEAQVPFRNWRWLEDRLRAFAVKLDGLPAVMSECGVASGIIQQRRHEIESLADELRALKDR